MAFCNACGATLDGGAKFCTKCGATQPLGRASAAVSSSSAPAATSLATAPKSNNALKVILIVVAVIVGLGILGIAAVSFIGYRIATHTRVRNQDGNVRVETPFGTVQSSTDPDEAARNLGIELYPGATVVKGTSSNMNMGSMHTAAAEFESSDPASSVAEFYKSKVPGANVSLLECRPLLHHFNRQEKHADHQHRAAGRQDQDSHRQGHRQTDWWRRLRQLTPRECPTTT